MIILISLSSDQIIPYVTFVIIIHENISFESRHSLDTFDSGGYLDEVV